MATIFFANLERKQFFKQNSPTGGTYLECWNHGREFAHILTTIELGSPDKLKLWMDAHQLVDSDQETYESYFFQFCREVEDKRSKKNQERQYRFENL